MDDDIITALLVHAASQHKAASDDIVLETVKEVKVPSSVLPPADRPSVHTGMYEALFTNGAANPELQVFLPQTIVYSFGRPSAWYSTVRDRETGRFVITKRRPTALKNTLILSKLLSEGAVDQDRDPRLDIAPAIAPPKANASDVADRQAVARALSLAAGKATDVSAADAERRAASRAKAQAAPCTPFIAAFISISGQVRYLDPKQLKDFVLLAASDERDGVLQQLVVPSGPGRSFDTIRVLWSPSVCTVDRRRNRHVTPSVALPSADAPRRGITAADYARMETFDGATYTASDEWPVTSAKNLAAVSSQARAIAAHFTTVTGGRYVIDSMAITGRLTSAAELVFMWADAVRVSEVIPVLRQVAAASQRHELASRRSAALANSVNAGHRDSLLRRSSSHAALTHQEQERRRTSSSHCGELAAGTRRGQRGEEERPARQLAHSRLRTIPAVAEYISRRIAQAEQMHAEQRLRAENADSLSTGELAPTAEALRPEAAAHRRKVDELYFTLSPRCTYTPGTGTDTVKQPPVTIGNCKCQFCGEELPATEGNTVSYASLLEASAWQPLSGAIATRDESSRQRPPFTTTSFVAVVEKTPSWARRAGDPEYDSQRPGSPQSVAASPSVLGPNRVPSFLRRLHPLMTEDDLAAYAREPSFRSCHALLCLRCLLSLTEGLALKTDGRLCDLHRCRYAGAHTNTSSSVATIPSAIPTPASTPTTTLRPPQSRLLAVRSPLPTAVAPSPSRCDRAKLLPADPPRRQLRLLCERLSMNSPMLGRPQSVGLVTSIRSQVRLFSQGGRRGELSRRANETSSPARNGTSDDDLAGDAPALEIVEW